MNRVCPQCMSAHVECEDMVISGASSCAARCLHCGWQGKDTDLIGIPDSMVAKHMGNALNPDQALAVLEQMTQHFLSSLASKAAQPIGLALVDAGFVGLQDKVRLGRMIRAACLGAVRGALAEAELIQKEESHGHRAS